MHGVEPIQTLEARTLLSSIIPDADGRPIYTDNNGQVFVLPYVTRAGVLVVEGTDQPDRITVDHFLGTEAETAGQYDENGRLVQMLVRYDDIYVSPVAYGAVIGALTAPNWQGVVDADARAVASAEQRLQALLGSGPVDASSPQIDEARSVLAEARQRLAFSQRTLGLIENGSLTRVRLGDVYDVYVDRSLVRQVKVFGYGGADVITFGHNVADRTWADGGGGADRITSGRQRTILYGGGGNDRLISRSTQGGLLVGGPGSDRYYNRADAEVQIMPRDDGDRVISGDKFAIVAQPGTFGVVPVDSDAPDPGRAYYLVEDNENGGVVDLLA